MLNNLEKGDIVAIRNSTGETRQVTVLAVKVDYERAGAFVRFDYIDYNEPSPMRRTAYPKELLQILQKNTTPKLDPKSLREGDLSRPQKAVIIDGKTYVEKNMNHQQEIPVTAGVGSQVHESVKTPANPVTARIKKAK